MRRVAFLVFALLIFCAAPGWSQGYERKVEVSWDFTTATDPLGWTTDYPSINLHLSNGALIFPAREVEPTLFGPSISVSVAPLQVMEVVMSSETTGRIRLVWADEFEGWHGDELTILGDGSFHHYYVPINTSSATTICRLAMDVLSAGTTVAIKSIALVTLVPSAGPPVSPLWQFDTDGDFKGWIPYGYSGVVDMAVSGGRLRIKTYANTTLLSPPAAISTQMEWFSLFGKVEETTLESPFILFNLVNTADNAASPKVCVYLIPDGADHVYNRNFGEGRWDWPTASAVSITLSENTTFAIERMQTSDAPQGRADVFVDALAPTTSLVRAGTPFQISCRVSDRGAGPVEQLSVQLTLPDDGSIRVISSPTVPATVQNGYPQVLAWTLVSSRAGNSPISVTAAAPAGGTSTASANILVNPSITPTKASYVPRPIPVSSKYDVGVYYMPSFALDSHWDSIRNFPDRRPVLGYYAEGAPQVIDWQIKWAVEHGIKFFALDWAWGVGGKITDAFFRAYFGSKYRSYMQFCINAGFDIRSLDEFLLVVKTWIEKYFTQPEYYKINGMPAVIIYDPWSLDTGLGGSSRQALNAARQLAADAGLGGIYFIGGISDPTLTDYGYDALSDYTLGGEGTSSPDESPYSLWVSGDSNLLGLCHCRQPYPLSDSDPGLDPRPGRTYAETLRMLTRTGSTASLFQEMLEAAKSRVDSGKTPPIVLV